jgi:hypothetical protein
MLPQLFFCRRCITVLSNQTFERIGYLRGRPQTVAPDIFFDSLAPGGKTVEEAVQRDSGDNGVEGMQE